MWPPSHLWSRFFSTTSQTDSVAKVKAALNVLAGLCGLVAAWLWWRASTVPKAASDIRTFRIGDSEGETPQSRATARRNQHAALFTAAAVLLGAIANLLP